MCEMRRIEFTISTAEFLTRIEPFAREMLLIGWVSPYVFPGVSHSGHIGV
jgi:hypothetical protein